MKRQALERVRERLEALLAEIKDALGEGTFTTQDDETGVPPAGGEADSGGHGGTVPR